MSLISKFFKRKATPPFDLEKAVSSYLLKLPRCSKKVVIMSPKYGQADYSCEIVMAAEDLMPWSEHHADAVWSLSQEVQIARKALPLWLREANLKDDSASYVHHFIYEVLRPYVSDFISDGTASIYCTECQSFVADVKMEKLNYKKAADWSWWTDVWTCPKGHQLYYQEQELHIRRRY